MVTQKRRRRGKKDDKGEGVHALQEYGRSPEIPAERSGDKGSGGSKPMGNEAYGSVRRLVSGFLPGRDQDRDS
jgi:hypothetical protein